MRQQIEYAIKKMGKPRDCKQYEAILKKAELKVLNDRKALPLAEVRHSLKEVYREIT